MESKQESKQPGPDLSEAQIPSLDAASTIELLRSRGLTHVRAGEALLPGGVVLAVIAEHLRRNNGPFYNYPPHLRPSIAVFRNAKKIKLGETMPPDKEDSIYHIVNSDQIEFYAIDAKTNEIFQCNFTPPAKDAAGQEFTRKYYLPANHLFLIPNAAVLGKVLNQ